MNRFVPGTGTIHSMSFKYASSLLKMTLYAKNEVFVLDVATAGRIYRSFGGLRLPSAIIVISDTPNIDLIIGHELGHDALERVKDKGILKSLHERNFYEEMFCDICGLEYWSFKSHTTINNEIFEKLLNDKIRHISNTMLDIGVEEGDVLRGLEEDKLRLIRAWEWLQYAMFLEKEGKIPEFALIDNPVDYELERRIGLQQLSDLRQAFL